MEGLVPEVDFSFRDAPDALGEAQRAAARQLYEVLTSHGAVDSTCLFGGQVESK